MFVPLALFMENNDLVKILSGFSHSEKTCVEDRKLNWVRGLLLNCLSRALSRSPGHADTVSSRVPFLDA